MQAFSSGKEMNGAMTYTFVRAIKENPNITYSGLLKYMHQSIEAANRGRCLPSLNLFNRKLEQVLNFLSTHMIYTSIS